MSSNINFSTNDNSISVDTNGVLTLNNNHYTTVDLTITETCDTSALIASATTTTAISPNLSPR
jgi:hypothetical protein